jgi:biotin carboxylase
MARIALVVPSTTYRAADFLDAAERLAVEVVVVSDQHQALASVMGDRALRVNLDDPDSAAALLAARAQRLPIDAVVGVDDRGVEVAALASARLGLPHNPPAAVAATRDKGLLRERLDGAPGVRQPPWRRVRTPAEAAQAAEALGTPVVVKPVSLSASRGVVRADTAEAAAVAASRTLAILDEAREPRRMLVERYVPGIEIAVEGLVEDGHLRVLAIFDKPDPMEGPFFAELRYVTPSLLPEAVQAQVARAAQAAVDGIGLTDGPVHGEFRVAADEVWTLEVAARTIGGLCGRALRFGLGMRLEEVVVRHALRLPLHALAREGAAAGVLMLPVGRAGVLRGVGGIDAAKALPGIDDIEITVPTGDRVRPLPEADRYLGFVFARGSTPEEVAASLGRAQAALDVRIDADPAEPGDAQQARGEPVGPGDAGDTGPAGPGRSRVPSQRC